jgi:hypothetical protein
MADKIKAEVRLAFLAYRMHLREPVFDLDKMDSVATAAVFEAFRPWNVTLENITFNNNPTNISEEATNFNVLGGRITFSITPGGCTFGVNNPNWSEADLIVRVGTAGLMALLKSTGGKPEKQVGTISMHLTPQSSSINQITGRFVKVDLTKFVGGPPQGFGFSVYRDDLTWVVDRSMSFQNSLFVRLDRSFRGDEPLERMAQQLNEDEAGLLELIGLEVD